MFSLLIARAPSTFNLRQKTGRSGLKTLTYEFSSSISPSTVAMTSTSVMATAAKTPQATAAAPSASATFNPVAPPWLDPGHNAWQMTAGTLVALQSIPGLVVLYAGWVKHKWSINSAFMAFYAFAAVLVCWVIWGYQMSFGTQMLPLVGYPAISVDLGFELEQSNLPTAALTQAFPQASMVYFQFVFAAITLILLAGSFLCRMNFTAWMIFVPLWLTFSYCIGAFSIWGGGFLFKYGVIDYSGGYVIHLSSGTAGFVGAWWIGPRIPADRVDAKPSNVTLMLVGAGILWTGWNGFNGGDPYASSPDAGVAVLNTNICTAVSLLVWVIMDLIFFKRPSVIGAVQGMITGLVAITPAAGVVAGWGAILLGLGSGTVPWVSMNVLGRTKIMRQVDDTLDVFHTHFVGAIVGGVGTGKFPLHQTLILPIPQLSKSPKLTSLPQQVSGPPSKAARPSASPTPAAPSPAMAARSASKSSAPSSSSAGTSS